MPSFIEHKLSLSHKQGLAKCDETFYLDWSQKTNCEENVQAEIPTPVLQKKRNLPG